MKWHLGIFKRRYRWTVLVGKGSQVYYSGGICEPVGLFPGPDIGDILAWVKRRDSADSVHIVFVGRTFESDEAKP